MNGLRNFLIVAGFTARRTASRRKTLLLVLLASAPALIGLVVRRFGVPGDVDPFYATAPLFYVVFLCQIIPLFLAGSLVRDSIEDGQAAYFLTSPTSRATYVLGSWFGLLAPIAALFLGSTVACVFAWRYGYGAGIDAAARAETAGLFGVSFLGAAIYAALFTWTGLVVKWPTVVGVAYYGIVDAFLGSLPGPPRRVALSSYLEPLLPSAFTSRAALIDQAQPGVDSVIDAGTARITLTIASVAIFLLLIRSARNRDFVDSES